MPTFHATPTPWCYKPGVWWIQKFIEYSTKLHPFLDNTCLNIMTRLARKDFLFSQFGCSESCLTNRKADTLAEKTLQSYWKWERMEVKMKVSCHFLRRHRASEYEQNPLFISDFSQENKHRVVPTLMSIVPKGTRQKNQGKTISQ